MFLITENRVAGSNSLPIDRERAEEPKLEASVDWKAEYDKAKVEAVCILITMPKQISHTQVQY